MLTENYQSNSRYKSFLFYFRTIIEQLKDIFSMSNQVLELTTKKTKRERIGDKDIVMIGYGCVGKGVENIISEKHAKDYHIAGVGVRNTKREEDYNFTTDIETLINSKSKYLLELIDDSENALLFTLGALLKKKSVISANKKMIAENFKLLFDTHIENQVSFLYEGAVAGGIPIIRNLENYYGQEDLKSIAGIINGSSNYILSKMEELELPFDTVLKDAQDAGFAESDPSLDIDGHDAKFKLCILAAHAFGVIIEPSEVLTLGIRNIQSEDLSFAKNSDSRFKLVAQSYQDGEQIKAFVLPQLVNNDNDLYHIQNEFNAVQVEGKYSNTQTFVGKGAGAHPTGSAVVSDLNASSTGYRYSYDKLANKLNTGQAYKLFSNQGELRCYVAFNSTKELEGLNFKNASEIIHLSEHRLYLLADFKIEDLQKINPAETNLFIARI